jgi:glycosyltransferase involved in cell wall biosynthesis
MPVGRCLQACVTCTSVNLASETVAGRRATRTKPEGQIRLVHHGHAAPNRRIEAMIEAVRCAGSGYCLDLYLVENEPAYMQQLRRLASEAGNVQILQPVPFDEIVPMLRQYDLGFYLLAPTNLNHLHALPNKFFEFVQAGLGVVIGPSPDMAAFAKEYGFGIVCPSFDPVDVAAQLRQVHRNQVNLLRQNALAAAPRLTFETYNSPRVLKTLAKVLS